MLISAIDPRMLDDVHQRALSRLVECVGEDLCDDMARRCLGILGLRAINTPNDLLRFGDSLVTHGKDAPPQHAGTIAMMGRLMRTRAILLGAKV